MAGFQFAAKDGFLSSPVLMCAVAFLTKRVLVAILEYLGFGVNVMVGSVVRSIWVVVKIMGPFWVPEILGAVL